MKSMREREKESEENTGFYAGSDCAAADSFCSAGACRVIFADDVWRGRSVGRRPVCQCGRCIGCIDRQSAHAYDDRSDQRTCYAFFFTGSDPSVLDLLSDSMESRKKALTERSLTRRGRFSWEAEKYKIRKRGFHGKDFMI